MFLNCNWSPRNCRWPVQYLEVGQLQKCLGGGTTGQSHHHVVMSLIISSCHRHHVIIMSLNRLHGVMSWSYDHVVILSSRLISSSSYHVYIRSLWRSMPSSPCPIQKWSKTLSLLHIVNMSEITPSARLAQHWSDNKGFELVFISQANSPSKLPSSWSRSSSSSSPSASPSEHHHDHNYPN